LDELRVLHVADLHIDSPMRGLVPYEDSPVDAIRSATRSAFRSIVTEAIEHEVHLVVIAGDLYDGSWRDYNTGIFVVSQLAELNESGIPVAIVLGNHDAESVVTKQLRLPPHTVLLSSSKPETWVVGETGIAVHGQSYADRAIFEDLSLGYPNADPGLVNIGMLHTCFDGSIGHEPYAPCTLDGLRAKNYDYWALGHVHGYSVICEEPLAVFPGNLQGRNVRETGAKGACLVTFEDRHPRVERLLNNLVRWEHVNINVSDARSLDDCLDRCRDELSKAITTGAEIYAIRVEFDGTSPANRVLRSQSEHLTAEVRTLANNLGGTEIWIEKVVVSTKPVRGSLQFTGDGVAGEIGRVLADLQSDVPSLARIDGPRLPELSSLRSQLRAAGPEMRDSLNDEDLGEALGDAAELLAALLGGEERSDAN
jgi:DNA repair exonuclease SbcCD nuclease subunit